MQDSYDDLDSIHITIESVEDIVINGVTLKKQTITTDGHYDWLGENIQLIGNTQMLVPTFGLLEVVQGPLRCYEDDTVGLYQTRETLFCDQVLSEVPGINQQDLSIQPNPASDHLIIKNSNWRNQLIKISVQNTAAACFYENTMHFNSAASISLEYLTDGFYFLLIETEDKIHAMTFVKQ